MLRSFAQNRKILRLTILLIVTGLFLLYFVSNQDEFFVLGDISAISIGLIFLGQVGIILTNTLFFIILMRARNVNIKGLESFRVIVQSSVLNFIGFLQGGAGFRAYYVKSKYGISYKKFTLLFVANYLVVFFVSALGAVIGLLLNQSGVKDFNSALLLLFFSTIILGIIFLSIIKEKHIPGNSNLSNLLKRATTAWTNLIAAPKLLANLMVIALFQYFLLVVIFYIELQAVASTPTFPGLLIYSSVATFSILIALTPAAIGFREGALVLSQTALGVTTGAIITSATIDRLVYFLVLICLGLIFSHELGNRKIQENNNET